MTEEPVSYRVAEGVAWITLDRPAVLNALDTDLAAALAEHAETAATEPDVMVVVVRGGRPRLLLGHGPHRDGRRRHRRGVLSALGPRRSTGWRTCPR